jgi:hypothetical protein
VSCALAFMAILASAALMTAATLAPAPLAVVPLAVAVCIGCPLGMAWSLPRSIAALRAPRVPEEQAVAALRRHLEVLPEVEHPLGL